MRRFWLCLLVLTWCGSAAAAPHFPPLTGRVVDAAHLLSPQAHQSLEQSLADYEAGTSNQVVVATIPSLEGYAIEDYGYQLGRAWKIGQKGKNNGALLIVAPGEHKVRIEVGYGLEPLLTDAACSEIIQSVIYPQLRAGHMEQGIIDGTQAMLGVLGGKSIHASAHPHATAANNASNANLFWLLLTLFFFFRFATRHPLIAGFMLNNASSWYSPRSSGSGWGDSGFSGGGGSFGGGGASGSW